MGSPQYSNCQCLDAGVTATSGFCQLECNNFIWYIGLFSLFVLIHSTSEVGSMLLTLRCVQAKDKAMAMGLIQFAIGLFGKNLNVKSFSAFVMSNRVVSLDS
jgi:hypothetical protein